MKKFTLLASILMFITMSYAVNVIPVEDAMKASKNFLAERVGAAKAGQMELVLVNTEYSAEGTPVTYRFSVGNKGFIIVSATDLANPILAFSLESNFQTGTGADIYVENYAKDLALLQQYPSSAISMRNSWDHYLASDFTPFYASKSNDSCVEPLVTTLWTQERYYNTKCPYNPRNKMSDDNRAPVGCVALTMANILYYYRYPDHGNGSVYYIPREYDEEGNLTYTYPMQSVNYSQETYDYDYMSNSLDIYDGELARLIYDCGVSVRMSYGWDGSGSQSEYALEALQDHFFFSDKAQFKVISDVVGTDQSLMSVWIDMAKNELNQHRPLFFSGRSAQAGGHAWIVDGYTTIGNATYFHVNWGWAGNSNGFYLINRQSTQNAGIFNEDGSNSMMISLMPDSNEIVKPAESYKRITASFGTISDGAGNMKYAKNSNRRWLLACPDATAYTFQFSKLKVKEGDKVTIYNGPTEASGVKKVFSGDCLMAACSDYSYGDTNCVHGGFTGTSLPAAVTVNADSVLVVFTSTANSETDYGFVLDYKVSSFNKTACIDKNFTALHLVLTDKPNNEISDETYRAANVCDYTLTLKFCDRLVWVFDKFDLKEGEFVDIYNSTSATATQLVAHYDNHNAPSIGEIFSFDAIPLNLAGAKQSRFYVRFASDNLYQGTGFELSYYGLSSTAVDNYDNVEISLYPNPASSYVNVEVAAEDAQVFNASVVDMMGKTVFADQFGHNGGTETYQIPVNNLAKGIYFLHLENENGNHVQKFIVQ